MVLYLALRILGVVIITAFVLYCDTMLYRGAAQAYLDGLNRMRVVMGNRGFDWSVLTGHHGGLHTQWFNWYNLEPGVSINLYARSYPMTEKVW